MNLRKLFPFLLFISLLTACQTSPDQTDSLLTKTESEENIMESFINSAKRSDTEKVLQLLNEGADINATDQQGMTAVMAATVNHRTDTVYALIQEGADINIRNHNEDNVLLYASAEGFLDIVKFAVEAGADTTLTNRFGGTALIPAADRGHVEIVEELLTNSDVDVNHINRLHWTALLEAVILGDGGKNHQKIVQLLLEHGADPTIGDRDGITPLEHAKQRGFKEMERMLEEAHEEE